MFYKQLEFFLRIDWADYVPSWTLSFAKDLIKFVSSSIWLFMIITYRKIADFLLWSKTVSAS